MCARARVDKGHRRGRIRVHAQALYMFVCVCVCVCVCVFIHTDPDQIAAVLLTCNVVCSATSNVVM